MELIRKAQADPKRFGPLYEKYYKKIFLFIYRRVADEDQTADITAQAFMKAITHLPRYEFKGLPFSAWLYRIASNEMNMFFRGTKNTRSITIEDQGLEKLKTELEEEDGEEEAVLLKNMQKLAQEEIYLLELRFFEDKSFKEIGFILNITEINAKTRTYRLLDKLKKMMKGG